MGKPKRVPAGHLVFNCELCNDAVADGKGFLTVKGARWIFLHDYCAERENVTCGVIPTGSGNRPCKIRVGLIATADQLLTALAALAVEIKGTNWLQLVQKIMWDTEYYFDPADGMNGGKTTAKQLLAVNEETYASAGFNFRRKRNDANP